MVHSQFYPKDDVTVSVTTLSPEYRHCRTCRCTISEVEITRKVRMTSPPRKLALDELSVDRPWIETEVCRVPYPTEKRTYSEHKYDLLESWFRKFDMDGDGFLDLYDMQLLLKTLGFGSKTSNARKMFDRADRNGDGLLSLQEFLLLWRHIALDEDNLMIPIIRKYQLYPDVFYDLPDHRRKHVREEEYQYQKSERCNCCHGEPVKPFARSVDSCYTEVVRDPMRLERRMSKPSYSQERLPIFSCHR